MHSLCSASGKTALTALTSVIIRKVVWALVEDHPVRFPFLASQLDHRNLALRAIDQRKRLTFVGRNPAPAPASGRGFEPHRTTIRPEHGHAHRSAAAAVDLGLTAGGRIRGPRVRDLLGFVGKTRRREEGQGRMADAARVGSAGSALYATDQGQGGKYGYTTACRWDQGRRRCTKWQESVYLGVAMVRLQLVEL